MKRHSQISTAFLTIICITAVGSNLMAQGRGKGNGGGGGGGGGDANTFNLHPTGFDSSSAFDVNDAGLAVGHARLGFDFAVAWQTNSSGLLTTTFLDDGVDANGVNANNEIVGRTIRLDGAYEARYWSSPTADAKVLPGFGGESSGALAISDSGIIAGSSGSVPVVWRIDNGVVLGPYALPTNGLTGGAEAITPAGDMVVGTINDGDTPLATVWTIEVLPSGDVAATSGPMNPLGNLWSRGHGISATGAICGRVLDGDHTRAFVWGDDGLELLEETRKTLVSVAWDVNDRVAVGALTTDSRRAGADDRDAVLWNSRGLSNLDADTQDAGFYDSLSANGVSESGIIVGSGVQDGWGRAFVRY